MGRAIKEKPMEEPIPTPFLFSHVCIAIIILFLTSVFALFRHRLKVLLVVATMVLFWEMGTYVFGTVLIQAPPVMYELLFSDYSPLFWFLSFGVTLTFAKVVQGSTEPVWLKGLLLAYVAISTFAVAYLVELTWSPLFNGISFLFSLIG